MIWIALAVAIAALVAYRLSQRVNVDHLPQSFVVFGLTTTGSDPDRHEIIEIGALRVERDATVMDSLRRLVTPSRDIPARVTELTGITQIALNREGKPLEAALREFREFIGELPLVSFNADVDMNFLVNATQMSGISIKNPLSCARKMAHRAWPDRKGHGLAELARADKSGVLAEHRVLRDCRQILSIYLAAASRLGTAQ